MRLLRTRKYTAKGESKRKESYAVFLKACIDLITQGTLQNRLTVVGHKTIKRGKRTRCLVEWKTGVLEL
jgi:hypothetical protein